VKDGLDACLFDSWLLAVCSLVELEATALGATETVDATQRRSCGESSITRDKMFETRELQSTRRYAQ
jgi:hypothetical protein